MSPRERLAAVLILLLGAGGLGLYLWPALAAPVVLWSDSRIDLERARQGVGIVSPAPVPDIPHPAKPGYLAYLRAASAGATAQEAPRQIVVIQSILLWLAISGVSLFLGRRTTLGRGVALYLVLLLFLRLRDTASAVMSEALSAALLLPFAALLLLLPPPGWLGAASLGCAAGALFLLRPNVGAAAAVLAVLTFASAFPDARRWRALLPFALGFALLVVPVWRLTASPEDSLYGLEANFDIARAAYAWMPGAGLEPATGSDGRRELVWRALRGVFGLEFYDARWSPAYARAAEWARRLSPVLLCAALASLLAPSRGPLPLARRLGLALFGFLVLQSFALGALPRLALPMLPALFLFAVAAWPPRPGPALAAFALLLGGVFWQRQILDREWGMVEASGVRIVQPIPRGALPASAPATLHVRIAPVLLPAAAELAILGPAGEPLYDSRSDPDRRRPYVTVPLPAPLLEANRRGPISLTLASSGAYGPYQYLLFPVVPAPWAGGAVRESSPLLSPSTGLASGSLDWWAHAGADRVVR